MRAWSAPVKYATTLCPTHRVLDLKVVCVLALVLLRQLLERVCQRVKRLVRQMVVLIDREHPGEGVSKAKTQVRRLATHTHDCENLSVGLEKQRTSEGKLVRLAWTVPVDGVEGRRAMCSEPAAARKRRLELPEARFRAAWLKQRPDMVIALDRRKKTQPETRPHAPTKKGGRARLCERSEKGLTRLAILTHHPPPPQHAMADKDKAGECVCRLVCRQC